MPQDAQEPHPLDEQLSQARSELQHLEELIADIPQLMQQRFEQQLHQVLRQNQQLLAERQKLLSQLADTPTQGRLPSAEATSWKQPLRNWRGFTLAICLVVMAVVSFKIGRQTPATKPAVMPGEPRHSIQPGRPKPLVVAGDAASVVDLEADKTSWVEVTTRGGELVWRDTLQPLDQRRIRLRDGLRLISSQPQRLRYRVDEGPWKHWPVGANHWLELVPADSP